MDVIEKARELGKVIQADERFLRYAKAKIANDDDAGLQDAIARFGQIRSDMENLEDSVENADRRKELGESMRKTYAEIMSSAAMTEYNAAKAELDVMMNEIQVLLAKTMAGEDPETCEVTGGCTGDCSSCGGCH